VEALVVLEPHGLKEECANPPVLKETPIDTVPGKTVVKAVPPNRIHAFVWYERCTDLLTVQDHRPPPQGHAKLHGARSGFEHRLEGYVRLAGR
jgi:hypothetical protein